MKRALTVVVFLALMLSMPQALKRVTHGFRPAKLLWVEHDPEWKVGGDLEEVRATLSRPFTYLARGSQAYVFASEDGRYVLKLLRSPQQPHPWREWVRRHVWGRAPKGSVALKLERVLAGTKLAFEEAREATQIAYVHLQATDGEVPHAHLRTALGRSYELDLNQLAFVLQRRAAPIREALLAAIEQSDEERFRLILSSFAELIAGRASKRIRNGDANVYRNFGCLGSQVVEWDFGNYHIDPAITQDNELRRFAPSLRKFIAQHGTKWLALCDQALAQPRNELGRDTRRKEHRGVADVLEDKLVSGTALK